MRPHIRLRVGLFLCFLSLRPSGGVPNDVSSAQEQGEDPWEVDDESVPGPPPAHPLQDVPRGAPQGLQRLLAANRTQRQLYASQHPWFSEGLARAGASERLRRWGLRGVHRKGARCSSIFFYHARKAAGSSLRAFLLDAVARNQGYAFHLQEGYTLAGLARERRVCTVTSLRDPVARVLSSYNYEGRWALELPLEGRSAASATPLHQWLNQTDDCSEFVWYCRSNCMTKWFSGYPHHPEDGCEVSERSLQRAVHTLSRFDLVVCAALLKDPSYVAGLQEAFRTVVPIRKVTPYKGEVPMQAKKQFPYTIEASTMQRLKDLNALDIELYRIMYDRVCRPAAR